MLNLLILSTSGYKTLVLWPKDLYTQMALIAICLQWDNENMWIKNVEIKVVISFFENVTTHTVRVNDNTHSDEREKFSITNISDDQIQMRLPKACCAQGHQVDIKVKAITDEDEYPFNSRAKVTSMEQIDDDSISVQLEILNEKNIDYQRFLEVFTNRQDQVEGLFHAIKGKTK